ncbi:DUF1444 family protein [Alloalcanivorax xenomutans]|uniref:DUF1444 family protein n=1 Tax=Alloalcanivorax xenomutans TaxID=1094342 RepID=UPI0024E240AA|nr:DUF1444 family protein [Alloalcanivorax xenomutans]
MELLRRLFGKKPTPSSGNGNLLDAKAFAQRYAATVKELLGPAEVRIQSDDTNRFSVRWDSEAGWEICHFLDNAYDTYRHDPENLDQIIHTYIRSQDQVTQTQDEAVVLPVIKTRAWLDASLEQMRQAFPDATPDQMPFLIRPLSNDELLITYVEDSGEQMRFVGGEVLEKFGGDREVLHQLALDNLQRQWLPHLQLKGGDGRYFVTLDTNYEASMALLFEHWRERLEVAGEPVLAIPARDRLMICGSEDEESLGKLRRVATDMAAESPYSLSSALFVFRDGDLLAFTNGLEKDN